MHTQAGYTKTSEIALNMIIIPVEVPGTPVAPAMDGWLTPGYTEQNSVV